MWKKPKKKREKILAPTTQRLKELREQDIEEYERLTKKVGHKTKN